MEDKELYTYFKDRKDAFNEAPGDALWAKIDAGLPNTAMPTTPKSGTLVAGKGLIIAVTVVSIIVTLLVILIPKKEVKKSIQPQQKTIVTKQEYTKTITETDTVKPKKVHEVTVTTIPFRVIKPQINSIKPVTKTTAKISVPISVKPQIINDTVIIGTSKINVATSTSPSNQRTKSLYIKAELPVSDAQFDQLVTALVNENSNAVGTTLIIKVKGRPAFRKKIDGHKIPVNADTLTIDVIKLRPVTDTIRATTGKTMYHANATGFKKVTEPVVIQTYVGGQKAENKKELIEEKVIIITPNDTVKDKRKSNTKVAE